MTKILNMTKNWNYALLTENVRYKCSDNFWREVLLFMINVREAAPHQHFFKYKLLLFSWTSARQLDTIRILKYSSRLPCMCFCIDIFCRGGLNICRECTILRCSIVCIFR